jgi:hypothetical protein
MTTYYVDGAVGNDANAGTSEGSGNAWATIDKAMNTVAANDLVYVKASATYNELATIDTAFTGSTHCVFQGYTSTPGDNGKVTWTGTTSCLTTAITSRLCYTFMNFTFQNSSATNVELGSGDEVLFYNCKFTGAGARGINAGDKIGFLHCEFSSNASDSSSVGNNCCFVGCTIATPGAQGLRAGSATVFYKCLGYGITGGDTYLYCGGLTSMNVVAGCTLDGEGFTNTIGGTIPGYGPVVDNIVYDHGTGLSISNYDYNIRAYNLLNSNSTADYTGGGGYLEGVHDVTSAPAFINEAGDDYRPSSSSPAVDAQLKPGGIT